MRQHRTNRARMGFLALLALLPGLVGCEVDYNSSSSGGTRYSVSETNGSHLATGSDNGSTRIRFDSEGL